MSVNSQNQNGAYHIANNPAMYELQKSNQFEFVVTDIDGILRANSDKTINNAQEVLRYSVASVSVPHYTQDTVTIRRGNSVVKFAGLPTFNDASLVINDYIGADGNSVLISWQNLSYDVKNQTVGRAQDYKKDCYLIEYAPDWSIVRQWKLHGCWIKGISEPEFNQDDGDVRRITANIDYDWAEMILGSDV